MAKASPLRKELDLLKKTLNARTHDALTPEEIAHRDEMEKSLHAFIVEFWSEVEGDTPFMDNWHIHAICDHLQACNEGKIRVLVINLPFRCMKSLICSVFFGAWQWTHSPSTTFFNLSGGFDLALRDSVRTRRLITSDKYQKYWGNKIKLRRDSNTSRRFENTKGGIRFLKSMQSSSIGFGAAYLMVDDPNSSLDIFSDVTRQRANEYISSSFGIRSDNPTGKQGSLILIQQRLHIEDCTGYLVKLGIPGLVHLMLPMEYDPDRACVTVPFGDSTEPWKDPRTERGELLWPERFSRDYVDNRLKKFLRTSHNINCQLQQNPSSQTGGVFKREWFVPYKEKYLPRCEFIIQSWDTALSESLENCPSAACTFGIFENEFGKKNIVLLNCVTVHLPHHELRRYVVEHGNKYISNNETAPPFLILIESAANGKALIDDLKRTGLPIVGFSPQHHGLKNEYGQKATSKIGRAYLVSTLIEQGLLRLPMREDGTYYPYAQKFLDAALSFPSQGRDIVDSMSQALIKIIQLGGIYYKGEEALEDPRDWIRQRQSEYTN